MSLINSLKATTVVFALALFGAITGAQAQSYWTNNRDQNWPFGTQNDGPHALNTTANPYANGSNYGNTTEFTIHTAAQLAQFAYMVNNGNNFAGKTVKLAQGTYGEEIDLRAHRWEPIGHRNGYGESTTRRFNGTFDGGGKTIRGLNLRHGIDPNQTVANDKCNFGLFGYIEGNATIRNIRMTEVDIEVSLNVTASAQNYTGGIGAIAGGIYSYTGHILIENCIVESGSTLKLTYSNNQTRPQNGYGNQNIGGIIGWLLLDEPNTAMTVRNCVNKANLIGHAYGYNGGGGQSSRQRNSGVHAGGIVGRLGVDLVMNEMYLDNCLNMGNITLTTSAQGSNDNARSLRGGGIIGDVSSAPRIGDSQCVDIHNCLSTGTISGPPATGYNADDGYYYGGLIGRIPDDYNRTFQNMYARVNTPYVTGNRLIGNHSTTYAGTYNADSYSASSIWSSFQAYVSGKPQFKGWIINGSENSGFPVLDNLLATAWVTYHADGGTPNCQSREVTLGGTYNHPNTAAAIPTRSGYTLDGWYTQKNGGGSKIESSDPFNTVTELFAKWSLVSVPQKAYIYHILHDGGTFKIEGEYTNGSRYTVVSNVASNSAAFYASNGVMSLVQTDAAGNNCTIWLGDGSSTLVLPEDVSIELDGSLIIHGWGHVTLRGSVSGTFGNGFDNFGEDYGVVNICYGVNVTSYADITCVAGTATACSALRIGEDGGTQVYILGGTLLNTWAAAPSGLGFECALKVTKGTAVIGGNATLTAMPGILAVCAYEPTAKVVLDGDPTVNGDIWVNAGNLSVLPSTFNPTTGKMYNVELVEDYGVKSGDIVVKDGTGFLDFFTCVNPHGFSLVDVAPNLILGVAPVKVNEYYVDIYGTTVASSTSDTVAHNTTYSKAIPNHPTDTVRYIKAGWKAGSVPNSSGGDFNGTGPATIANVTSAKDVWFVYIDTLNTFTVKFNGNGSDGGSMADQVVTNGLPQNLRANTYTRYGYIFNGWTDGFTTYADGASVNHKSGTLNLMAEWVAVSDITVYFDHNDIITPPSLITTNENVTFGAEYKDLAPVNLSGPANYDFNGWFLDGFFVDMNSAAVATVDAHTLYASWLWIYSPINDDDLTIGSYIPGGETPGVTNGAPIEITFWDNDGKTNVVRRGHLVKADGGSDTKGPFDIVLDPGQELPPGDYTVVDFVPNPDGPEVGPAIPADKPLVVNPAVTPTPSEWDFTIGNYVYTVLTNQVLAIYTPPSDLPAGWPAGAGALDKMTVLVMLDDLDYGLGIFEDGHTPDPWSSPTMYYDAELRYRPWDGRYDVVNPFPITPLVSGGNNSMELSNASTFYFILDGEPNIGETKKLIFNSPQTEIDVARAYYGNQNDVDVGSYFRGNLSDSKSPNSGYAMPNNLGAGATVHAAIVTGGGIVTLPGKLSEVYYDFVDPLAAEPVLDFANPKYRILIDQMPDLPPGDYQFAVFFDTTLPWPGSPCDRIYDNPYVTAPHNAEHCWFAGGVDGDGWTTITFAERDDFWYTYNQVVYAMRPNQTPGTYFRENPKYTDLWGNRVGTVTFIPNQPLPVYLDNHSDTNAQVIIDYLIPEYWARGLAYPTRIDLIVDDEDPSGNLIHTGNSRAFIWVSLSPKVTANEYLLPDSGGAVGQYDLPGDISRYYPGDVPATYTERGKRMPVIIHITAGYDEEGWEPGETKYGPFYGYIDEDGNIVPTTDETRDTVLDIGYIAPGDDYYLVVYTEEKGGFRELGHSPFLRPGGKLNVPDQTVRAGDEDIPVGDYTPPPWYDGDPTDLNVTITLGEGDEEETYEGYIGEDGKVYLKGPLGGKLLGRKVPLTVTVTDKDGNPFDTDTGEATVTGGDATVTGPLATGEDDTVIGRYDPPSDWEGDITDLVVIVTIDGEDYPAYIDEEGNVHITKPIPEDLAGEDVDITITVKSPDGTVTLDKTEDGAKVKVGGDDWQWIRVGEIIAPPVIVNDVLLSWDTTQIIWNERARAGKVETKYIVYTSDTLMKVVDDWDPFDTANGADAAFIMRETTYLRTDWLRFRMLGSGNDTTRFYKVKAVKVPK